MDAALAAIARLGSGLDETELGAEDIAEVLEEAGVAVIVPGGDVDDLEESYQEILETAAACSGGTVTVSGVKLTEDENGDECLNFLLNGKPTSWPVEHQADGYLDQLAVWEYIDELEPGADDQRVFHPIPGGTAEEDVYVLATPEQALALRDAFPLKLDVQGLPEPGEQSKAGTEASLRARGPR
ncbi:hypothetical protein ACIBCM_07150 [Streptomyces sp. NPDC051018]|uniref:hypothetical protein n=1 Tax=Streptomyces sp. NPDC051018 TaxID=3365639 RepID=UPI003799B9E7